MVTFKLFILRNGLYNVITPLKAVNERVYVLLVQPGCQERMHLFAVLAVLQLQQISEQSCSEPLCLRNLESIVKLGLQVSILAYPLPNVTFIIVLLTQSSSQYYDFMCNSCI